MRRMLLILLIPFLVLGCVSFAAAQVTQAQANISWTDVTGEDSYRVERSDASGPYVSVGTTAANVVSFINVALALNTQYCWRIVGTSAFGDAPPSAPACGIATTPGQVLGVQVLLTPYP